jgi:hypothetical protein
MRQEGNKRMVRMHSAVRGGMHQGEDAHAISTPGYFLRVQLSIKA